MRRLHIGRYGPAGALPVLAIHGITANGARWKDIATQQLSRYRVIAPDLIGHGFSASEPPWSIEAQVDELTAIVDDIAQPPIVVGHSYGALLAIHLSHRIPVAGLILLDPAIAIDPAKALEYATATIEYGEYADLDAARAAKRTEGWEDVPAAVLEATLETDLINTGHGTLRSRISRPAIVATWGELTRPARLPTPGIPVTFVRALRVQPPYTSDEYIAELRAATGDLLDYREVDCGHMVPQVFPELVGRLVDEIATR